MIYPEPQGEPAAFNAGGGTVSGWDGRLFFDGRVLEVEGDLAGVVALGDEIAVVSGSENLKIVREVGFIGQTDDIYSRSWDGSARLWRIERPADLLRWVQENRFIREFTLPEKRRYRIEN